MSRPDRLYPEYHMGRGIYVSFFSPFEKQTYPNTLPLLLFPCIPILRTLATLASGGFWLCEPCMEIQLALAKQTDLHLFFPIFTHSQLKIKNPLWSQAWN